MKNLIDSLRDRLNAVTLTCYIALGLILAFSLYVDTSHAHTWVEKNIPFFWSFFAYGAAATIIGFARWFGHSGIMARPDYYDASPRCRCQSTGDQKPDGQA